MAPGFKAAFDKPEAGVRQPRAPGLGAGVLPVHEWAERRRPPLAFGAVHKLFTCYLCEMYNLGLVIYWQSVYT